MVSYCEESRNAGRGINLKARLLRLRAVALQRAGTPFGLAMTTFCDSKRKLFRALGNKKKFQGMEIVRSPDTARPSGSEPRMSMVVGPGTGGKEGLNVSCT